MPIETILFLPLLYLFVIYYLATQNKYLIFLLIPLIFSHFMPIISNIYIEYGHFISEQNIYGRYTGATFRLTLLILFFFFCIYFFSTYFFKIKIDNSVSYYVLSISKQSQIYTQLKVYLFLTFLLILIYLYSFITYGIPLLNAIPRSEFLLNNPLISKIRVLFYILASLFGVFYTVSDNKYKKIVLFVLFSFILLLILSSDKASGPQAIIMFFTSSWLASSFYFKHKINYKKLIIYLLFFVIIILLIVSYVYMSLENLMGEELLNKIIDRLFGLQGHVWYGIDYIVNVKEQTKGNLESLIGLGTTNDNYGLSLLMYEVANTQLVNTLLEKKISFTMGYPAISILFEGYYFAFVLQIMFGLLFSYMLFFLHNSIKQLDFYGLFIGVIGFKLLLNAFSMGNIHELLITFEAILFYISSIFYLLIKILFKEEENV